VRFIEVSVSEVSETNIMIQNYLMRYVECLDETKPFVKELDVHGGAACAVGGLSVEGSGAFSKAICFPPLLL
jgi:hypothetical protein